MGDVLSVLAVHSPLVTQGPGTSWFRASVWPEFMDLVCRLLNCSFLGSNVCPLVSEAGLVQASWQEGLVPAHWWVELGLGLLVGRAMSRGVSRGTCGLRKS